MDFADKMDLENERVLKLIFPDGVPGMLMWLFTRIACTLLIIFVLPS